MLPRTMTPIFPVTALTKEPKEVKARAQEGPVRITENGRGAYVFMSESVFADLLEQTRQEALYEAYLVDHVGQGVRDIEKGRYVTSRAEMFAQAAKSRADHA